MHNAQFFVTLQYNRNIISIYEVFIKSIYLL